MSNVNFVLDEMAVVGHLESVDNAIGLGRAYGIRLQFYFQSMGQLSKCFPDGQAQTVLSNTSQVLFGINDNATADWASARLGEETIVVESSSTNDGSSKNFSQARDGGRSDGRSTGAGRNFAPQARKLLKPEELMALPPRVAITFTPGVPPVCTTLLRYYEEKWLTGKAGRLRNGMAACAVFMRSAILCVFLSMLAVRLVPPAIRLLQSGTVGQADKPPYQNYREWRPGSPAASPMFP